MLYYFNTTAHFGRLQVTVYWLITAIVFHFCFLPKLGDEEGKIKTKTVFCLKILNVEANIYMFEFKVKLAFFVE